MKTSIIIASLACVASSPTLASPAYPFTPAKTNFSAPGRITLTTSQGTTTCQQMLTGATDKNGMAHIYGAVYSGKDVGCAATRATGLPWKVMPTSATSGKIIAMGLTSGGVTCGPSLVHLSLKTNGVWSYSGASITSCTVSASMHTTPAITPKQ
jgi:hypothetical protein